MRTEYSKSQVRLFLIGKLGLKIIFMMLILLWHFKIQSKFKHPCTSPYPLQRGNCTNANPPLKGVGGCFVVKYFQSVKVELITQKLFF